MRYALNPKRFGRELSVHVTLGLGVRSREALVNMFNVKNDLFAQKQVDDTTQTRFGVLLSFVVLPSCLILYSCLWFVTFYLGLERDRHRRTR